MSNLIETGYAAEIPRSHRVPNGVVKSFARPGASSICEAVEAALASYKAAPDHLEQEVSDRLAVADDALDDLTSRMLREPVDISPSGRADLVLIVRTHVSRWTGNDETSERADAMLLRLCEVVEAGLAKRQV